jgi:hypothetical protein
MKLFLRYIAYRELYRSIQKLLKSSGNSQSQTPTSSQTPSGASSVQELLNHPNMPANGKTDSLEQIDEPQALSTVPGTPSRKIR